MTLPRKYYSDEEWEDYNSPLPSTGPSDYVDLVNSGILEMDEKRYNESIEMVSKAREIARQQHLIEMLDVVNYNFSPADFIWLFSNGYCQNVPNAYSRYLAYKSQLDKCDT